MLVAAQTSRLQQAFETGRRGLGRYDPAIMGRHIIVCGDPSVHQVTDLLKQIFHPDHAPYNDLKARAVVLSPFGL